MSYENSREIGIGVSKNSLETSVHGALYWRKGTKINWGQGLRNDNSKVHVLNKLFVHIQNKKCPRKIKT